MYQKEIELESCVVNASIEKFKLGISEALNKGNFGTTKTATTITTTILKDFVEAIEAYLDQYSKGRAIRSTLAAEVITRLKNIQLTALVASRVLLNSLYEKCSSQTLYRKIGQALEDEWKMQEFRKENLEYYKKILKDLQSRNAKGNRIKTVIQYVFAKQLEFHLEKWTATEKIQTGMVLVHLFMQSSNLITFDNSFVKGKHIKTIIPTEEAVKLFEDLNNKFSILHPTFLPMVCSPKPWSGIFDGGYLSPYLKRNKLIKNNSKEYLSKLKNQKMPMVYNAINHIQMTEWQINNKVLEVAIALWEEGKAVAELPDREDEALPPYPYPDITEKELLTEEQLNKVKAWKAETYAIHKRNVQKRSIRIATAHILRIAQQFKEYEKVWFPYNMDFRGRLYPIPVLLQPQGSDLAKGLLRFAQGKAIIGDENALKWLQIHGSNMYGYDKVSYEERIKWVKEHQNEIHDIAKNPLENQSWTEADKPFQFLAWCFEYAEYLKNPTEFKTHLPIQLDGSCNGLQHYSALLKDKIGGQAVNLIDTDTPSDIYSIVADKLRGRLEDMING